MAQDEQQTTTKKEGSGKSKSGSKERKNKAEEKSPTKVIIRRLPPTMTEDVFIEQIDPLPENDFFYYVKGEVQIGVPTFSRAYINFKNQEDIFTFQDKFDGYVFLDQRGTEFQAVVEFAPYQKIPRSDTQAKEDKCNTIDNDAHYLEFVKKLENPEEITLVTAEAYLEQIEQKEREMKANGGLRVNTPLVEFIINRRLEKEKFREEKKEERKRKDMEKKKQRDLDRLKKKEGRKDKTSTGKGEEKTSFKVLKNTERNEAAASEKSAPSSREEKRSFEKATGDVGAAPVQSKKMPSDKAPRSRDQKNRDKPPRGERKENPREKGRSERKNADVKNTLQNGGEEMTKKGDQERSLSAAGMEGTENTVKTNDIPEEKKRVHEDRPEKTDRAERQERPDRPNRAERQDRPERQERSERTQDRELREGETESERRERIRNKDRPAMQIYRPGTKRSGNPKQGENSCAEPSSTGATAKRDVKTRTFTRSTPKD